MTKPEPKLSHMPEQIKQLIVDNLLDHETKKSVGFLSKDLHACVKKSPVEYGALQLRIEGSKVVVEVRDDIRKDTLDMLRAKTLTITKYMESRKTLTMEFHPHERGALMRNTVSKWEKVLEGKDYRKAAVRYFLSLFNNSKTRVKSQELYHGFAQGEPHTNISQEDQQIIFDEIQTILKRFRFQLLVETLWFGFEVTDAHILKILPYLKPGTLQTINLNSMYSQEPSLDLTEIVETDQWKQAEILDTIIYKTNAPLDKWTNARSVEFRWAQPMATLKEIVETFLSKPNLNRLRIKFDGSLNETDFPQYISSFPKHRVVPGWLSFFQIWPENEPGLYILAQRQKSNEICITRSPTSR